MQMVPHDDVAQQLPAMADHGAFEPVNQSAPVRIVADDLLAGIAPCHHVVNGALEFDSESSWHAASLDIRKPIVNQKQKTKSDTAKPPSEADCQSKTKNQV
jgi:hypothetical protein